VWSATYDAFGKASVDTASSVTNNLRFPGQYFDEETGLQYNYKRYFDPTIGRYITEDPIGIESGDENFYRYCVNDPVNLIDPKGLFGDGYRGGDGVFGHSDIYGGERYNFTREDHGPTSPWPWGDPSRHFRDRASVERDLERAINRCTTSTFESLMHQGQDSFSHYDKGYRWNPKAGQFGHAEDLKKPDKDVSAWYKANDWTERWVGIWEKKCGKPCK